MRRNQDLRRKIAGCKRVIEHPEDKIRLELTKPDPNEFYIAGWQREIEVQKSRAARLNRRLKRAWK